MKEYEVLKSLYKYCLGELAVKYLESLRPAEVLPILDSEAMILLTEIKAILDDDGMDDSQCLQRIDALVSAFQVRGIQTDRHDW